jgi:hypothetical protein
MKRFNTFKIAVASLVFALTAMSGGAAGAEVMLRSSFFELFSISWEGEL